MSYTNCKSLQVFPSLVYLFVLVVQLLQASDDSLLYAGLLICSSLLGGCDGNSLSL